jgi:diaminopimelate epimerase
VELRELLRQPFYKMTGSGNDFVFLDARATGPCSTVPAGLVAAVCARGAGVGADGLVVLDAPGVDRVRIAYYNSDGSRAALCGNATLCSASLAVHLGAAALDRPFVIETDAGALRAAVTREHGPEFNLEPLRALQAATGDSLSGEGPAAESRIGFAIAGVPHLVVRVADVDAVAIDARAPALRRPTAGRPDGANVNYVSPAADGRWRMRTFERGVEGETLACGTGAVACAAVLRAWGEAIGDVELLTASGQVLAVALDAPDGRPRLRGEGRLVFTGTLAQTWEEQR